MKRLISITLIFILIISADANFINNSKENNSSLFKKKEINEGVITYDIEYLSDTTEKAIISLLPTEMTIKFNNNQSIQTVEGWMGIFKICGIVNEQEKTKSALLKIMADKYFYTTKINDEKLFGFNPMNGKRIQYTNKTKKIAGYKCKKAIITWGIESFDVYYTDKIKIAGINWNNSYPEIDGVLLQYQVDVFGIKTVFTAKNIEEAKIDSLEFLIPEDFKESSYEELDSIINKLM